MSGVSGLLWSRRSSWLLAAWAMVGWAQAAAEHFQVGPFRFEVPVGWAHRVPESPMRKAELRSPDGKGEAVFFFFGPNQGGTAEANVARWLSQVSERTEEKVESETIGGHRVTFVRAVGTYASGMPGGPTTAVPGSMLLGAILESPEGNVFVRMTGPKEAMKEAEAVFRAMVRGAAGLGN